MSDAKKAILARRAQFVAAAIAGLGAACGKENANDGKPPPGACLSVAYIPDASASDAGQPAPDDIDVRVDDRDAAARPDARPHPCLSIPLKRNPNAKCTCHPNDPLCSCL